MVVQSTVSFLTQQSVSALLNIAYFRRQRADMKKQNVVQTSARNKLASHSDCFTPPATDPVPITQEAEWTTPSVDVLTGKKNSAGNQTLQLSQSLYGQILMST